jgi:hypothetical protein
MAPGLRDYVMTDMPKSRAQVIMADVIVPQRIAQCALCDCSEQCLLPRSDCKYSADGL